ncbi:uncharacterized protein MICPUCDRAFT_4932, partial [Micromonas pusilla CCMP1545]
DRYEFLREIGAGSFGRVFLARRRNDGKLFAVKVVDISAMDGKSRAETKNEVDVLKMLSHPNVVRYHEAALARGGGGSGGSGGRGGYGKPRELRIVMEYVSRGDLGERVKEIAKMRGNNGRNDEVMSYFTQIALALRHLHRKGILHRDLKLANVFVNEGEDGQDVVKLGDFGISKVLASQTGFCNTVVGTPYYLSPEMCMGRRYDAKSDVWALGCVLYELCNDGAHAFEGKSLPALVMNILKGRFTPLSRARFGRDVRELQTSLLALEPGRRPSVDDALRSPAARACLTR